MKIKISKSQWEKIGRKANWIKASISPEDVQAIKELRDKSTISLNDAQKYLDIIKDCTNLSSGTMATLTKINDYSKLDIIQQDFITFVKAMIPKMHYETWMEAWNDFLKRTPNYLK